MDNDEVLPEGTIVKVELEIRLPHAASRDQVEEWVEHEIGRAGGLSIDNPLYRSEPQAWGSKGVLLTDTGMIGTAEEYDHAPLPNGGRTYRVRYLKTPRVGSFSGRSS